MARTLAAWTARCIGSYDNSMAELLTPEQQDELAADLDALRESLESLLAATADGEKPVQLKDNKGRLTRMDEMHNQSILKANRNVTKNRLQQVNAALQRIAGETYGECVECAEPIAFARLKAYPEASLCLECKSLSETS